MFVRKPIIFGLCLSWKLIQVGNNFQHQLQVVSSLVFKFFKVISRGHKCLHKSLALCKFVQIRFSGSDAKSIYEHKDKHTFPNHHLQGTRKLIFPTET